LLDDDYALAVDGRVFDLLLLGCFESAFLLGLLAHALDGIHHVTRLRKECVTQIRSPLNVIGKPLYHIWQRCQCLDGWIPRLFSDGIGKFLVLEVLVPPQPLLELHDLEWISRCRQNLCQQGIGI